MEKKQWKEKENISFLSERASMTFRYIHICGNLTLVCKGWSCPESHIYWDRYIIQESIHLWHFSGGQKFAERAQSGVEWALSCRHKSKPTQNESVVFSSFLYFCHIFPCKQWGGITESIRENNRLRRHFTSYLGVADLCRDNYEAGVCTV